MTPTHHPGEDLLVDHALGRLPASLEVLVATHLVYCPHCRSDVALAEEVAGLGLEDARPAPVDAGALAHLLARIDADDRVDAPVPRPAPPTFPEARSLPRTVLPHLPPAAAWSGWVPGYRAIALTPTDGPPLRLVRLAPGATLPLHTHEGEERTLVLAGDLTDDRDRLLPGDLLVLDGTRRHAQRVTGREACVCLVANDAPIVPLTWLGRLARRLTS